MEEMKEEQLTIEDIVEDEEVLKKIKTAKTKKEGKVLLEEYLSKQKASIGKTGLSDEELDTIAGGSLVRCKYLGKILGVKQCYYMSESGYRDYPCDCSKAVNAPKKK